MQNLPSKTGQIFPQNGTYLGMFKITDPKCTETGLKNSPTCPIWSQTDTIWMASLTSLPTDSLHDEPCQLSDAGMVGLDPKWFRLAPNGTNPGLFQIRFQCILRPRAKCTEIWSENTPDLSHLGPIWPTLEPKLPSLVWLELPAVSKTPSGCQFG